MSGEKEKEDELMEGSFSFSGLPVDHLFPEANRLDAVAAGHCIPPPIGCGQKVDGFRDQLSAKEYQISGFCQSCQDSVSATFDDDDDDEEDFWTAGESGGEA